jgi:hypothetical protein
MKSILKNSPTFQTYNTEIFDKLKVDMDNARVYIDSFKET